MKKKRLALATGVLSLLGLVAYAGHKKQVKNQQAESDILAEVRAFFAPMGTIDVLYVTEVNSRAGTTMGGVVFDDGVTFEFRYRQGDIDYRELVGEGGAHATSDFN